MKLFSVSAIAISISMAISSGVSAQSKASLKIEAGRQVQIIQKEFTGSDKCALGISIYEGPVVIRAVEGSPIRPGDKILSVNGVDARKPPEHSIELISSSAPNGITELNVERGGNQVSLSVPCRSKQEHLRPALQAYQFAASGKFGECADAFNRYEGKASREFWLIYECTSYKKGASSVELAQAAYNFAKAQLEEFTWIPSAQSAALMDMRRLEPTIVKGLGQNKYDELVEKAKAWPGGDRAYKATEPDWNNFKRSAELAVNGRLIDPSSAQYEWPHGFVYASWKPFLGSSVEGYVTCGIVNARNRMGGYTGRTYFVVVLDVAGNVKYTELGNGKDFDILSAQCAKSASMFPLPQFTENPPMKEEVHSNSIADELLKLSELKRNGIITELEFQTAKEKLLGSPK